MDDESGPACALPRFFAVDRLRAFFVPNAPPHSSVSTHRELDRSRGRKIDNVDDVVRQVEERHKHSYRASKRDYLDEYEVEASGPVALPTSADPKLFVVECKASSASSSFCFLAVAFAIWCLFAFCAYFCV